MTPGPPVPWKMRIVSSPPQTGQWWRWSAEVAATVVPPSSSEAPVRSLPGLFASHDTASGGMAASWPVSLCSAM
jgi:hypothetical protein